jgi:hypothetical protein
MIALSPGLPETGGSHRTTTATAKGHSAERNAVTLLKNSSNIFVYAAIVEFSACAKKSTRSQELQNGTAAFWSVDCDSCKGEDSHKGHEGF